MEDPDRSPGPADPHPPHDGINEPDATEVSEAICGDILAIHRDSYGRGADRVLAHVIDHTVIVLLDGLELLPNEEFMLSSGHTGAVIELRQNFQKAIEPTFRAAVERATGSRVVGFSSHVHLEDRPFAVEIFRLDAAKSA